MSETESQAPQQSGKALRLLLDWGPTLLFNIIAPIITFNMLKDHGMAEAGALLISSAWPVADLGIYFALHRRLDEFGIFSLVTLSLSALSAVAYNSTKLIFLKDSALTCLIGLGFLVTLLTARPAMFYFGRKFASGGTAEGVARWNGLWEYEGFRRGQRRLTVIWGVGFIAEALLKAALTYALDTSTMLTVSSIMPWAVLGGLIFYTVSYGKRSRARMQATLAAAAAAAAAAEAAEASAGTPA
ncbi:VC0807 family protein [Kitasatospora camelliae]|uniref:VC0807 family protein n=1 Tax=Kitasatospora camelliae TaxID=3156397 RepID=A0AAU8JQM7_9ACTN